MPRREWTRRSVHIGLGSGAFLVPHLAWWILALSCAAGCAFILWIVPRWAPLQQLERAGPNSGRVGLLAYPAVLMGLLLVYREQGTPVLIAWLALAVGDGLPPLIAAAGLCGPNWPWNKEKAVLPSSLAFVAAGLLAAIHAPLALAAFALSFGMLAESLAGPGDDNLRIPIVTALATTGGELLL